MDAEGKAVQFEDGSQPGISCTEEQSADPDATWLKKGKKSQFGYRSYLVVDAQDGYVRGIHIAPCLLYTSPSPRDRTRSRMPSSA